jgi:hypothetical protein
MDILLIKNGKGKGANLRSMIGERERWVKFRKGAGKGFREVEKYLPKNAAAKTFPDAVCFASGDAYCSLVRQADVGRCYAARIYG